MTTIAWDGRYLAADRQVTFGNIANAEVTKVVKRKKDGAVAAAAGNSVEAADFRKWFLKGEKGKRPSMGTEADNSSGLIIYPDGKLVIHEWKGSYEATSPKYTNGSGWEIALGAMLAGASAEEAVRLTSTVDGMTGSSVDVVELG